MIIDVDFRLAGSDPNIVIEVALPAGAPLQLQVSSLQLSAVARVRLAPLVDRVPCVGAVTVSLMGYPFFDCSLDALSGNVMAFPGLPSLIGSAIRSAVRAYVWPQRLVRAAPA